MVDRAATYVGIREKLSRGRLRQAQVEGFEAIFDEWDRDGTDSPEQLAYVLATAWHETGEKMEPVRESFATTDAQAVKRLRNRRYARRMPNGNAYYGRGFVQLTHPENYRRAGRELDLPLYEMPDMVMEPKIAAKIIVRGMIDGWFTGKSLADYINDQRTDYEGARRIINGTDRKELIADYARKFEHSIVIA